MRNIVILCVIILALTATIMFFVFNNFILTPPNVERTITTEVVQIEISGNTTRITEIETGSIYSFTSRRVIRRNNAPTPTARIRIDNDVLRIYTHRGTIIVYEIATSRLHIL